MRILSLWVFLNSFSDLTFFIHVYLYLLVCLFPLIWIKLIKIILQVSTEANRRMDVFRHYFLSHSGARSYTRSWTKELTLDPTATWMMEDGLTWEFARDQVNAYKCILRFKFSFYFQVKQPLSWFWCFGFIELQKM